MKAMTITADVDSSEAQANISLDERNGYAQAVTPQPATIADSGSEGLHGDLEQLLKGQIQASPKDVTPLVRLIELYFDDCRREDFLSAVKRLEKKFGRDSYKNHWKEVQRMGRKLLPNESLFMSESDSFEFEDVESDWKAGARKRLGEDDKYAEFFATLAEAYEQQRKAGAYVRELDKELQHTLNRPVSMMHARQISKRLGGAQIYLKREDLSPPFTHLGISVTGQAVLARRLGKKNLVTASTNGFRAVMVTSIARRMGLKALVFLDENAVDEQPGNMRRLELMGADVHTISRDILKTGDLREVALEYCMREPDNSFMVMGLDGAPPPYPQILMESAAVIGRETLRQIHAETNGLPSLLVTRGGDNADAIGFFAPFLSLKQTRLACIAPIANLVEQPGQHSDLVFTRNYPMHKVAGSRQKRTAKRLLEGLEYPGVSREQAWLMATGRVIYEQVTHEQVIQAVRDFSKCEGMIPAMETAHALAYACEQAGRMKADESVVVLIAEQVDKDIPALEALMAKAAI